MNKKLVYKAKPGIFFKGQRPPKTEVVTIQQRVDTALEQCVLNGVSTLYYDPDYVRVPDTYYAESMFQDMCQQGLKGAQRLKGGKISVRPRDKGHDTFYKDLMIEVKVLDKRTGQLYHDFNATQKKTANIFAIYNPNSTTLMYKGNPVSPNSYLLIYNKS